MAELLWSLNAPTSMQHQLQSIVEYLGGKKFYKLTCCKGSVFLQGFLEFRELFEMTLFVAVFVAVCIAVCSIHL